MQRCRKAQAARTASGATVMAILHRKPKFVPPFRANQLQAGARDSGGAIHDPAAGVSTRTAGLLSNLRSAGISGRTFKPGIFGGAGTGSGGEPITAHRNGFRENN